MKKLSDLINTTVDQKEVLRAARAQAVSRRWSEIVGDLLATKSTPDRFERGTLWIQATEPTWAQEIRLREDTIVQRLNQMAAEPGLFRDIKVGVGPRRRDLME